MARPVPKGPSASHLCMCVHMHTCTHTSTHMHTHTHTQIQILRGLFLKTNMLTMNKGLPWWLSHKEPACQHKRCRFDLWIGENPLQKEMATQSSIPSWEIPWTEEPGRPVSTRSQKRWIRPTS